MADNQNPEDRPLGLQSQDQKQSTHERDIRDRAPKEPESGTLRDDEEAEKPVRDPDKSVNGEEFDRQGRNPKPFSVG